ncbi:MAG: DUF4180 domain-containing protein [Christensenellaceae bacterium]|jgi:hypothetical protein|nr:DUF4180 domain-containing protein [Christensenellaceae bacterium]
MPFIKDVRGNSVVAIWEGEGVCVASAQDALDMLANVHYEACAKALLLPKSAVAEAFFDLKTGLAGEVLQKFVNYRLALCILGDFSGYGSQALRDFIYESNKGGQILFMNDKEEALNRLHALQQ